MSKKYTLDEFMNIVEELRSENGCPWDKVQTHESLRPYLMEEAAEVLASIRIYNQTGNADNMCEELGDVLLQIALHAQIAKEEGLFEIDDIISGISKKMIRRHPHVFATKESKDEEAIKKTWEEIKKAEKESQTVKLSPLREIPQELPSITRATKIIKKAEKNLEPDQIFDELQEQILQLKNNFSNGEKASCKVEMAEILMNLARVSVAAEIMPEQVLYDKIEEYISEYEKNDK